VCFYSRLGGENLAVAQNTYSVMWFKGKELNMVFGLLLSISRIVRGNNTQLKSECSDLSYVFSHGFPSLIVCVCMCVCVCVIVVVVVAVKLV